ncbi:MAG: DUF1492 domain-containing protein [Lachnospiraceae bacterium]|nr:DUF1492 domain-containing protein [Lachnospiraceae bacterium]
MTAKEYLRQYIKAKQKAEMIERQLAEIDDLIGNMTVDPTIERVQSSRDPDQIGKLVAKQADLLADLMDAKAKALDVMQEVCLTINKLKEPDDQLLLQARYIECRSWKQIIDKLHYNRRWVFRMHRRALIKIEKIINRPPKAT